MTAKATEGLLSPTRTCHPRRQGFGRPGGAPLRSLRPTAVHCLSRPCCERWQWRWSTAAALPGDDRSVGQERKQN